MTTGGVAYFLDSSFLASAYLADESTHDNSLAVLRSLKRLITSELATVETSRAIANAARGGRLPGPEANKALRDLELDLGSNGPVEVLPLDGGSALGRARELVVAYPTGTLDAIHLAVADREGRALAGDDLVFMTHDGRQRAVAAELGLAVG